MIIGAYTFEKHITQNQERENNETASVFKKYALLYERCNKIT